MSDSGRKMRSPEPRAGAFAHVRGVVADNGLIHVEVARRLKGVVDLAMTGEETNLLLNSVLAIASQAEPSSTAGRAERPEVVGVPIAVTSIGVCRGPGGDPYLAVEIGPVNLMLQVPAHVSRQVAAVFDAIAHDPVTIKH